MASNNTILSINFDLVDYRQVFEAVDGYKASGRRELVTITNPHSVLMCHRDEKMMQATQSAGLVLPDGAGIILAANILGYKNLGRVTGPDLMLKLCDWGREKGFRHFFYGGDDDVAKKLVNNLTENFPGLQVAGAYCPPFRPLSDEEDNNIVGMINDSKTDIVWVGLGAPKQEKWMLDHTGKIKAAAMIGVGAAFDFHSGNVKWAPAIVRRLGIEWAWRLIENPKRMWWRNLDSPIFLTKVLYQRIAMALSRKPKSSPSSKRIET